MLFVKEVKREARFGCTQSLTHVGLKDLTDVAGLPIVRQPFGIVVYAYVREVERRIVVEIRLF